MLNFKEFDQFKYRCLPSIKASSLKLPEKVFIAQTLWIIILFALHIASQSYNLLIGNDIETGGSMQIINLDNEGNLPAWYSASALFLCAIFFAIIAYSQWESRNKWRYKWAGLAAFFAYLSLDESASLHENFIPGILRRISGISSYDWTPIGIIICVAIIITYFQFWLNLPPKTRWLFASACAIFVLGAIGFEKISHFYEAMYQSENTFQYVLTCGIEEMLEMWGVAILTYGLISYLFKHVGFVRVHR